MSRSKSDLSLTERTIIQFIRFRTKDPRHPTYFGSNEDIAKHLDIQPNTAKKYVNKLVREGYLAKGYGKNNRRHLAYTNKPYVMIVEDMRNYEKRALKQDKEYFEREARDAQYELKMAKIRIETLEKETSELNNKLFYSNLRVHQLENLFTSKGITKEQIDRLIE